MFRIQLRPPLVITTGRGAVWCGGEPPDREKQTRLLRKRPVAGIGTQSSVPDSGMWPGWSIPKVLFRYSPSPRLTKCDPNFHHAFPPLQCSIAFKCLTLHHLPSSRISQPTKRKAPSSEFHSHVLSRHSRVPRRMGTGNRSDGCMG